MPFRFALIVVTLLAVSVIVPLVAAKDQYIEDKNRLIGWKGSLPSRRLTTVQGPANTTTQIGFGQVGQEVWKGHVELVSWAPRAFLLHNFLTDEECDHLIEMAQPHMSKSSVVDSETGKSVDSEVRTSTGTFFARAQDEIIAAIERRIALVSMLPEDNGEGLQILHYVDGQKYEPHHDYFHDSVNSSPEHGGQRVVTVLMYLSSVGEGGETVFPSADTKVEGDGWSDCARKGAAVKPVKGNALLFYSLHPDGNVDPKSLHGSCPTTKGEKWSATKWIHCRAFGLDDKFQKAKWGDCVDANDMCGEWASYGECDKNPNYMMVHCRRSCKRCEPKASS